MAQTPRGLHELFFEEVGKAVNADTGPLPFKDQPGVQRIVAIGIQFGIEMLPPLAQRSRA